MGRWFFYESRFRLIEWAAASWLAALWGPRQEINVGYQMLYTELIQLAGQHLVLTRRHPIPVDWKLGRKNCKRVSCKLIALCSCWGFNYRPQHPWGSLGSPLILASITTRQVPMFTFRFRQLLIKPNCAWSSRLYLFG